MKLGLEHEKSGFWGSGAVGTGYPNAVTGYLMEKCTCLVTGHEVTGYPNTVIGYLSQILEKWLLDLMQ